MGLLLVEPCSRGPEPQVILRPLPSAPPHLDVPSFIFVGVSAVHNHKLLHNVAELPSQQCYHLQVVPPVGQARGQGLALTLLLVLTRSPSPGRSQSTARSKSPRKMTQPCLPFRVRCI